MDRLLEMSSQVVRLLREKSLRRSAQGTRVSAKEREIFFWHRDCYGGHRITITHGSRGCQAAVRRFANVTESCRGEKPGQHSYDARRCSRSFRCREPFLTPRIPRTRYSAGPEAPPYLTRRAHDTSSYSGASEPARWRVWSGSNRAETLECAGLTALFLFPAQRSRSPKPKRRSRACGTALQNTQRAKGG
jgi:hypothetical protein